MVQFFRHANILRNRYRNKNKCRRYLLLVDGLAHVLLERERAQQPGHQQQPTDQLKNIRYYRSDYLQRIIDGIRDKFEEFRILPMVQFIA